MLSGWSARPSLEPLARSRLRNFISLSDIFGRVRDSLRCGLVLCMPIVRSMVGEREGTLRESRIRAVKREVSLLDGSNVLLIINEEDEGVECCSCGVGVKFEILDGKSSL